MEEEIITPEEAGVVVDVDTTVEEVSEVVASVGEEVVSNEVTDENVALAEEVLETVEETV